MRSLTAATQQFFRNCRSAGRVAIVVLRQVLASVKPGSSAAHYAGTTSFLLANDPDAVDAASTRHHAPLWLLRKEMADTVADCPERARDRIIVAIYRARNGMELWLLRIDIFQCISHERGQQEARRRINELRPLFSNLIPSKQLVAI